MNSRTIMIYSIFRNEIPMNRIKNFDRIQLKFKNSSMKDTIYFLRITK